MHVHTFTRAVKAGELSYMTLIMEREQTAYRSILPLAGALLVDPEPIPLRLVRGCIAMPFTARVRALALRHRLVDAVKGGELSYMALSSRIYIQSI